MSDPQPPRPASWLLRTLLRDDAREFIEGDLREEYHDRVEAFGKAAAGRWFWRQTLSSVVSFAISRREVRVPRDPGANSRTRSVFRGPVPWRAIGLDLHHACRGLLRRPTFSLVVVGILAVGVGGTSAVFTVSDWLLFRPVPGISASQDRLAIVQTSREDGIFTGISYPNLLDLEVGSPGVQALAGVASPTVQVAGDGLTPATFRAEVVSEAYFALLGVEPALGRLFYQEEYTSLTDPVVVVSHRLWTEEYRAERDVVGRTLRVNGDPYTIVGVAARGFRGLERTSPVDLWHPASDYGALRHMEYDVQDRGFRPFMQSVALLAPGVTAEQAEEQLRDVMVRLVRGYPEDNQIHEAYAPTVYAGIGVPPVSRASLKRITTVMFAVSSVLLLIACANVANLLVFLGARRGGAIAVRRALGASRGRIVREHLAEALILSMLAGGGAVLVAAGFNEVLWRGDGTFGVAAVEGAPVGLRVLLFTLVAAVTVPVAFAIAPAALAARTDVAGQIQSSRRTGSVGRARLRGALTIFQLALSLSLVVGSVLLFRTLAELRRVDPGFDPADLLVFTVNPEPQGHNTEEGVRLHLALLARALEVDDVSAATLARTEPYFSGDVFGYVIRPDQDRNRESDRLRVQHEWVGPDYFSTLGVAVVRGRSLSRSDMTVGEDPGNRPVMVNESLAQALFGSVDVVGQTLVVLSRAGDTGRTIVGIARDIRDDPRGEPSPAIYEPFPRVILGSYGTLIVRAGGSPEPIENAIRAELASLDPNVPIYRSTSLEETIASTIAEERMLGRLLGILAVLAGGLAAVGLYAVVGWTVNERTREIGIRIALGAKPRRVAAGVIRGAAILAAVGTVVGLGASILVARLLESRLFGVEPFDLPTWAVSAGVLIAVATAAAAQPALRAASIRPVEALRSE